MRILFLHGLESQPNCQKVKWLQDQGHNVQSPDIDYHDNQSYEKIYKLTRRNNYDVIVGSSMGGWFAWNLGKEMGVPVLLLNPALHSRTVNPTIGSWIGENHLGSKVFLAIGNDDIMINPVDTLIWLRENDTIDWNPNNVLEGEYGHRTPIETFIKVFNHFEEHINETNELYRMYGKGKESL